MKQLLTRLMTLLLCLCLLPASALAFGDTPIYKVPVTRADLTVSFALHPEAFPNDGAADYQGWADFLSKLQFKGVLDVQQPLTEDVRGWFDGGLYLKDRLTVPFQVDVYQKFRYMRSRALRGESLYFQMDNFFEFMMKPCYYMDLPTETIALLMYPEASVEMYDRFVTPLAELCRGEGERAVSYDDLYDLCLSWEDMYMNDAEDTYKLYYFLTCLLYDLGINYDVYDQIGMMTSYLDQLDPEGAGMTITVDAEGAEVYTIGETVVFTRQAGEGRNFTLTLPAPDELGSSLTLISEEQIGSFEGDDWQLTLSINGPADEEQANYLTVCLDMDDMPFREHYETVGTIRYTADGTWLEEPFAAELELQLYRNDLKKPHYTKTDLSLIHPETREKCFTLTAAMWLYEEPYTVLQERAYDQEDIFHLNDEYLQRVKEAYIPSLAVSFLPVIAEMPAGVINDILRFAEETDILVSLGVE